jgi:hypothetical protein
MDTLTLHSSHGGATVCTTDDAIETTREFELGLHIAALFAILVTSTFGTAL